MCPDRESNPKPFGAQDDAPTELPDQGPKGPLFKNIYLFLRGEGKERNIDWLRLARAVTGDRTHNAGLGPNQESNWQPSTPWDDAQQTKPHWPGLKGLLKVYPF